VVRGARKALLGVEVLEDDGGRRVLGEQAVHAIVDLLQARFEGTAGVGADHAAGNDDGDLRAGLDEPVARGHETGVDAEETPARQPRWPRGPRRECRSWRRRTVRRPAPPALRSA